MAAASGAAAASSSATPGSETGGRLVATVRAVKPGVVAIGTHHELRRPPGLLIGTGFAVADGRHVITNAHVLPPLVEMKRLETLAVFAGTGPDMRVLAAVRVSEDAAHDLALLRLVDAALPPLALGDDGAIEDGHEIAVTGFPIGGVLGLYPVTHRGIVAARSPIALPQLTVNRLNPALVKRLRAGYDVFQLDATAYPGNSGSPVYDRRSGAVLGVVSSVFIKGSKENLLKEPSGITYAVPIRYARALILAAGLTP